MENWKKALVGGAAGASAIMFIKKKPAAGVILAGVSLVTLALEYPRHFAKVRRALPDYFGRGLQLADFAARTGEHLAKFAEKTGRRAWNESRSR